MSCKVAKFNLCRLVQESYRSPIFTFPNDIDVSSDTFKYTLKAKYSPREFSPNIEIIDAQNITIEPFNLPVGDYEHELIWTHGTQTDVVFQGIYKITNKGQDCGCAGSGNIQVVTENTVVNISYSERVIERHVLTFDDLTPENIEELQRPAAEAAQAANEAATEANEAADLANSAAQNADAATMSANQAASSANTAAGQADNAANAAANAASQANTAAQNANDTAASVQLSVNNFLDEKEDEINTAVGNANSATNAANGAAGSAITAATNATSAANAASSAATNAATATTNANNAASAATSAAGSASNAASAANSAATNANNAASSATTAAGSANTAASSASTAASSATTAAGAANAATTNANNAADAANAAANTLLFEYVHSGNLEVNVQSLDYVTGVFTTATPHGLDSSITPSDQVNRLFIVFKTALITPDPVVTLPMTTIYNINNYIGYYITVLSATTFTLQLTFQGAGVTVVDKGTVDFSKWHFEGRLNVSIISFSSLNTKNCRIVAEGQWGNSIAGVQQINGVTTIQGFRNITPYGTPTNTNSQDYLTLNSLESLLYGYQIIDILKMYRGFLISNTSRSLRLNATALRFSNYFLEGFVPFSDALISSVGLSRITLSNGSTIKFYRI